MDKRFQVFVSSTFRDLTDERRAVIEALLEMDAIPAGMELFPAADSDAWTLIERVIAESDYYVLIIGGRYGSTDADGISYTEREYDYAVKAGIPVLAFLHEHPEMIPAGKSELKEDAQARLAAFRSKVEDAHHCKYWNDAEQLGSRVSRALVNAIRTLPRIGWVRADQAGGPEALAELNRLRLKIDELSAELQRSRVEPPKGTDDLLQQNEEVPVRVRVSAYSDEALAEIEARGSEFRIYKSSYKTDIGITWDEVFAVVGPLMLHECTEYELKNTIESKTHELLSERDQWYIDHYGESPSLAADSFQTIKMQLIALGLIQKADRKRPISDTETYWTLTPYGETHLMKLRALKRGDEGE